MLSIYKYKVNNGRGDHPVRSRLIDEFVVQIGCCHQGLSELDFYGDLVYIFKKKTNTIQG